MSLWSYFVDLSSVRTRIWDYCSKVILYLYSTSICELIQSLAPWVKNVIEETHKSVSVLSTEIWQLRTNVPLRWLVPALRSGYSRVPVKSNPEFVHQEEESDILWGILLMSSKVDKIMSTESFTFKSVYIECFSSQDIQKSRIFKLIEHNSLQIQGWFLASKSES